MGSNQMFLFILFNPVSINPTGLHGTLLNPDRLVHLTEYLTGDLIPRLLHGKAIAVELTPRRFMNVIRASSEIRKYTTTVCLRESVCFHLEH